MKLCLASIALLAVAFAGCSSKPTGPTYAESVATYQAEVALLDSLESRLSDVQSKYDVEKMATKSRFEKDLKESDEHEAMIRRGFRNQEDAKPHIEESARLMLVTLDIRDKEYLLARINFDRESKPLMDEIELQRASVANAKQLRDSLSR